MKVYLVGGAVRDQLLGLPVKEKDWVVVGATPEEMLAQGFKPVGKDFPVFIHPKTHEEYALARTERKTGKGYKGFSFHADRNVTLEEDLQRRDLTINAIAQDESGQLIDPYHGQDDLNQKIFRHVSPAFQEDPVRILRLARFATRFPNFRIHVETNELMKNMVANGEVDALVAERVWQELTRALEGEQPIRFFQVLQGCNALTILFPHVIDARSTVALERAPLPGAIRLAALLHNCDIDTIKQLITRYRIPNDYGDLALLVAKLSTDYVDLFNQEPSTILRFILQSDAIRRPLRFEQFMQATSSCYPVITEAHHDKTRQLIAALKAIDLEPLKAQKLKGEDFAKALEKL